MDERGTRTLVEAVGEAIQGALLEARTATPARIEAYSASDQRATVLPLLKRKTATGDVITPKPIPNVPVLFPRGGGFAITLPIAAGDVGLLVCSDRSLDIWLEQGGAVDPQSRRHHAMTDAVFLPGLHHWGDAIATADADDLVIAAEDGNTHITITPGGEVQIKGSAVRIANPAATAALAMAAANDANWNALAALLTGWIVVPADGGAALKVAATTLQGTGWPASTAATKVFGE